MHDFFKNLCLSLVFLGLCQAPVWSQRLELVESFPVGTDFDQADIRDTQEVWLEMINGAQEEILWQTFYLALKDNSSTSPVVSALKKAAKRGVKVSLLVDEKFAKTYPEPLKMLASVQNIEVRHSPIGRWYGGVMHAKAMFVDGKVGFIGSQNFDWRSLTHIRELGLLFESERLVADYIKVFRWEWKHHSDAHPPASLPQVFVSPQRLGNSTLYPTFSPSLLNERYTPSDETEILDLLKKAENTADIALLSYSPVTRDGKRYYAAIDNALRAAAVRGVKVRVLLSHWVEKKKTLDHLKSLDALNNIEVRACRIPLTDEGEIPFARVHHSKYLVVDDRSAWLGTANWSQGYFHSSRNFGMVLQEGKLPERMSKLFDFDWARSSALKAKKASDKH